MPLTPPRSAFTTLLTTPPALAALQQIYREIPAPAARIKRPGKAPDLTVPVQIERRISLLVLKYSKMRIQFPIPAPGWVRVRVCAKSGMLEPIP